METEATNRLTETRAIHTDISKKMMRLLATAPIATAAGNLAPNGEEGSVKPKADLKPKTLMLNFNPQEFQAWQEKFKIYYQASRMAYGSIGVHRRITPGINQQIARSRSPSL